MALGLGAALGHPAPASAQEVAAPAPSRGDFTFRRVRPPEPGGGPRITVQIDPEEQARLLALPLLPPPANPPAGVPGGAGRAVADDFGWFWQAVEPGIEAGAGRFQKALDALADPARAGSTPAPRLQHLQEIAARHGPDILLATVGTRVSPALVLAVIAVESSGRVDALSHKGAQGLMQLIPATAERFGVGDAHDASENIRGGVAYLDWLLDEFNQDAVLALAGYNAGENAVRRNGGVPPFAETRAYVPKVLAAWKVARGLCLTPPELPGDGCVFRVAARAGP
ncbi:lytic transglycosylase domain-containing protein [Alkalilacustris brevis]|uniref:lytic transglycosylase domain-containing protein n=1 Tax=Alkalilacustris brevis TaxID=2026338 RepID=UPI003B75D15F